MHPQITPPHQTSERPVGARTKSFKSTVNEALRALLASVSKHANDDIAKMVYHFLFSFSRNLIKFYILGQKIAHRSDVSLPMKYLPFSAKYRITMHHYIGLIGFGNLTPRFSGQRPHCGMAWLDVFVTSSQRMS